ncbi:MAG: SOS response-associated peptidase family protein, partial [Spirochaetia bacterium]|nr:SOS response-associated peptidase family protein [Spirochaetia bacterium]
CGRYALFESMEYLRFLLDLEEDIPELLPRYNIAPSQAAPIAVPGSSVKRRIIQARFGFASDRRAPTSSQTQAHAASRPAQVTAALDLFGDPIVEKTKRPSGPPPKRTAADPIWINARAETVATLPSFRDAFQKRRCLIPASGFYEWKKTSAGRGPSRRMPS